MRSIEYEQHKNWLPKTRPKMIPRTEIFLQNNALRSDCTKFRTPFVTKKNSKPK